MVNEQRVGKDMEVSYTGIYLEVLRKTTKKLHLNSRDMNPGHHKYKADVLMAQLKYLVLNGVLIS
jgi:hypothetical protein